MSPAAARLAVSVPNARLPDAPRIALVDPESGDVAVPELPAEVAGAVGITGMALAHDRLYLVGQQPPTIFVLGAGLELEQLWPMSKTVAAHSIVVAGERAWVVSTGTDAVVELRLDGGLVTSQAEPRRLVHGPDYDQLHLNGLCSWNDRLILTGLGRRPDPAARWSTAVDGFVQDLESGELLLTGLAHPHSPTPDGDDLLLCESRTSVVRTLDGRSAGQLEGYTRGLAVVGDTVFAGVSRGRRLSESSGTVENPADPGRPHGRCSLYRLSRETLAVRGAVDLSAIGREIYDVAYVEDASGWPLLDREELQSRLIRRLWDAYEETAVDLALADTRSASAQRSPGWTRPIS